MTEGRTGLNIKDYPFAFSITALFFPSLLTGTSNTAIFGVLLIGGMIGSLLTIINPGGILMKYHYARKDSFEIYNGIISDHLIPKRNLIEKIIKKNFKSAAASPTITFESDKTIAMIYFLIVLGATIVRTWSTEFATALNNDVYVINGIRIGVVIGLIGVVLVLLNHHFGFNFKFSKIKVKAFKKALYYPRVSISHFDRIICVTIANLAIDFGNLINESNKWIEDTALQHHPILERVLREFHDYDKEIDKVLGDGWTGDFQSFKEHLEKNRINYAYTSGNNSWNENIIQDLYNKYKHIKEIAIDYDVGFSEALSWFGNTHHVNPSVLYDIEPKMRTFTDARDWSSANLTRYRITDMIEIILRRKNIPAQIDSTFKL